MKRVVLEKLKWIQLFGSELQLKPILGVRDFVKYVAIHFNKLINKTEDLFEKFIRLPTSKRQHIERSTI